MNNYLSRSIIVLSSKNPGIWLYSTSDIMAGLHYPGSSFLISKRINLLKSSFPTKNHPLLPLNMVSSTKNPGIRSYSTNNNKNELTQSYKKLLNPIKYIPFITVITAGLLYPRYSFLIPKTYASFTENNREQLNILIEATEGGNWWGKFLLSAYSNVNKVCNLFGITLTDEELSFFEEILQPGVHKVSFLIDQESKSFTKGSIAFKEGSLDHSVRVYRISYPVVAILQILGDPSAEFKSR